MNITGINGTDISGFFPTDVNTNIENKSNNLFSNMLKEINKEQIISQNESELIATGKTENLQNSILKIDQASISLNLALSIQNKLLTGFKEIINTQI